MVPPVVTPAELSVEEGAGPAFFMCTNPNLDQVSNTVQWYDEDVFLGIPLSTTENLTLNSPVLRTSAGRYFCQVTSLLNGDIQRAGGELIVECKWYIVLC